jgi:hypothetical protein
MTKKAEYIDTSRLRSIVRARIAAHGVQGATCDEVEALEGMLHQTASARIRELFLRSAICDSGKQRNTRSGRPAIVWVAARVR